MFYDIFLVGYVNGLQTFLHVSENGPREPGAHAFGLPHWTLAFEESKLGLGKHRKVTELAQASRYVLLGPKYVVNAAKA
jgi:hypothetical protein